MLAVFTYAARYSAFNPVEHLWSVLSNKLSGVVFSSTLEDESKPPCEQSKLSNEKKKKKNTSYSIRLLMNVQNIGTI